MDTCEACKGTLELCLEEWVPVQTRNKAWHSSSDKAEESSDTTHTLWTDGRTYDFTRVKSSPCPSPI